MLFLFFFSFLLHWFTTGENILFYNPKNSTGNLHQFTNNPQMHLWVFWIMWKRQLQKSNTLWLYALHVISMSVIDLLLGQYGWMLAKFFFAVFIESRSITIKCKYEWGQYPAILVNKWSTVLPRSELFRVRLMRQITNSQDWPILPT